MSERVAGDGLPIGGPCDHCGKVKPYLASASYEERTVRLCHDDTDDCYRETRYGYYLLRPDKGQEPESPYLRDI